MKTNRFLAYLAIAVLGCSYVTGCDDNDNPPPPEPSKDERIIKVNVTNGERSGIPDVADMIFIQAGK